MATRLSLAALASDADAADALIDRRIAPNTKKRYECTLKVLKKYWLETYRTDFTVPVDVAAILAFFAWLIHKKPKKRPAAFASIRLYKTALVWYYNEHNVIIEPATNRRLELLLTGYRRDLADLKLSGQVPLVEGKLHLTFAGYHLLAVALLQLSSGQMLFAWPYLVLQWNLIARATTVASLMMEHVGWEADALMISMPKHKGDQEGVKGYARHLYANVSDPVICPVLALAVLVFTRVLRHDPAASSSSLSLPNYRIFDGSHSESRFSDILKRAMASLPESDARLLGGDKGELGTHSVRKGAATYCAGMVGGPSPVHICLRAGWTLGGVLDRYIFADAGGDQVTGRVLSGLSFNEASFASLPPHLSAAGVREIVWTAVLPLYDRLPETFKRALPYLLASICHHEDWLRSTLSATHPLFSTFLFTSGAVTALKPHLLSGCYRCLDSGLAATGIPTHLAMSNHLQAVVQQSQVLRAELQAQCAGLPASVVNLLLSKCSINGAIPVTLDDLRGLLAKAVDDVRADVRRALPQAAAAPPSSSLSVQPGSDGRFHMWAWGGKLHPVEQGWRLPATDIMATWRMWYFGIPAQHIGPLRTLKKCDLVRRSSGDGLADAGQASLLSKTHGVMTAVTQQMIGLGLVESEAAVGRLSESDAVAAFSQAIVSLIEKLAPGSTQQPRQRWMELSISTHHKRMLKRKRSEADRQESEAAAEDEAAEEKQAEAD